jgi:hypothetical protein
VATAIKVVRLLLHQRGHVCANDVTLFWLRALVVLCVRRPLTLHTVNAYDHEGHAPHRFTLRVDAHIGRVENHLAAFIWLCLGGLVQTDKLVCLCSTNTGTWTGGARCVRRFLNMLPEAQLTTGMRDHRDEPLQTPCVDFSKVLG